MSPKMKNSFEEKNLNRLGERAPSFVYSFVCKKLPISLEAHNDLNNIDSKDSLKTYLPKKSFNLNKHEHMQVKKKC